MAQAADVLGLVGTTIEQVVFDACVDAGGFGLIYRGRHVGLDEPVAIKCLRITGLQSGDEDLKDTIAARFKDETKLLYRLSQGSLDIVRCIGSGTLVAPRTNEITPYMVLEWLDGQTLSVDLKERRERRVGGRSLAAAVELLDPAVNGLAYAHAQGVVHRDVKPGNIFLVKTREGVRTKILDFGLAKILEADHIGVRPSVETQMGVHFCSPSYGAPEQFTQKAGPIGPWTDIYSLTLVLLEMMTGVKVRPAGNLAQGLVAALDSTTGSPSASSLGLKLPAAVEDLLLRAVAQNPLERPRDAGVFWNALKDVMRAAPPEQMAATIADANVAAAMERIRAEAIAKAEAKAKAKGSSPFAGTILMQNAPSGAPHLVPPEAKITAPPTSPRTDPLQPPLEPPKAPGSPLAASVLAVQPPPAGTAAIAPMRSPAAATAMGSVPPPALAAPGPGPMPMPAPAPLPPAMPITGSQQAPPAPMPSRAPAPLASARPAPPKAKANTGFVVLVAFVLLVFVAGVGSALFIYLRHR